MFSKAILLSKVSCRTVSKALLKSRAIRQTNGLSFINQNVKRPRDPNTTHSAIACHACILLSLYDQSEQHQITKCV